MNHKLLKYFVLPKEATEVEIAHVKNINQVALWVCLAHIPLFLLVAWLCQTSMLQALSFGSLLVLGPTIATFTLNNPRALSLLFGFTAMGLGALLVHLGQGPMQIEMHFHFFAALALLTVWGNPMIIWVATLTVATHHGLFWLILPNSVFNYEASLWVVVVHAAFVIVEAIAAAFIARNFFDNVIGLEKIVRKKTEELQHRTEDMKTILDNTEQGFLTVNLDGSIDPERSAVLENWFASIGQNSIFKLFEPIDRSFSSMLSLGWSAIIEDLLPIEITIDQLPKVLKKERQTFGFIYKPIVASGKTTKILVVISDLSATLEQAKMELNQRETIAIFERISRDRSGFLEFIDEGTRLVSYLVDNKNNNYAEAWRAVHTLKGTSSLVGVMSIASLCHTIEDQMAEQQQLMPVDQCLVLQETWNTVLERLNAYSIDENHIQVEKTDLLETLSRIKKGVSREEIFDIINSWRYESLKTRFNRIADQSKALAERLGKAPLDIRMDHNNLRLPQVIWSQFWAAFSHAIRNSIDHGFEPAIERTLNSKQPWIKLSSKVKGDSLIIEIEDNGKGIDWEAVKAKCQTFGLASGTRQDLIEALFFDGFSTMTQVNTISGRGVGMGSLRQECLKLGGSLDISSETNLGTKLIFRFPLISLLEHENQPQAA